MDNGFLNTSVEACYHYMWIYRFYFVYSDFLPALNMDLSPVRPSPLSSYLWQEIKKHSFYSCSYNWSLLSLNWCVFIELMVWLLNFWFFIDPKPLLPPPPPHPSPSSLPTCPNEIKNTSPIVNLTIEVYCHWTDVWFLNCLCGYWTHLKKTKNSY